MQNRRKRLFCLPPGDQGLAASPVFIIGTSVGEAVLFQNHMSRAAIGGAGVGVPDQCLTIASIRNYQFASSGVLSSAGLASVVPPWLELLPVKSARPITTDGGLTLNAGLRVNPELEGRWELLHVT